MFNMTMNNRLLYNHVGKVYVVGANELKIDSTLQAEPQRLRHYDTTITVRTNLDSFATIIKNNSTYLEGDSSITVCGIRRQEGSALLRTYGYVDSSFYVNRAGVITLRNKSELRTGLPYKIGFAIADLDGRTDIITQSIIKVIGSSEMNGSGTLESLPLKRLMESFDLRNESDLIVFSSIKAIGETELRNIGFLIGVDPFIYRWNDQARPNTQWYSEVRQETEWRDVDRDTPSWRKVVK